MDHDWENPVHAKGPLKGRPMDQQRCSRCSVWRTKVSEVMPCRGDEAGKEIPVDEAVRIAIAGFQATGGMTPEKKRAIAKSRTEVGRLVAHLRSLDGTDPDLVLLVLLGMFTAAPMKAVTAAAVLAVQAAKIDKEDL